MSDPPEIPPDWDKIAPIFAAVMTRHRLPKAEDWIPSPERTAELPWATGEALRRASYYKELTMLIRLLGIDPPENPELLSILPFHPYPPDEVPSQMAALGFDSATIRELLSGWVGVASLDLLTGFYPAGMVSQLKQAVRNDLPGSPCLVDPYYGFFIWREGEQIRNHSITYGPLLLRLKDLSEPLFQRFLNNRTLDLCQGVDIARERFAVLLDNVGQAQLAANEVPEIIVERADEFLRAVALLGAAHAHAHAHGPGGELWFRGQTEDYLLPDRTGLVKKWITPWSDIRDSSLVPNLYRHFDRHLVKLEDWEHLVLELAEWVEHANLVLPEQFTFHDIETGEPVVPIPTSTEAIATAEIFARGHAHERAPHLRDIGLASRWTVTDREGRVIQRYEKRHHMTLSSYMRGLLLQHYGAPTAWLDITKDPRVALWFALRKMEGPPDGMLASPHTEWGGDDRSKWPTIYVFPLIKGLSQFLDTETILQGTPALRPQRQHCGLLGGGGNLARNYPARYIGLKIRLAPGFKPPPLPDTAEMFPGPDEDSVLKQLLERETKVETPRNYPVYQIQPN